MMPGALSVGLTMPIAGRMADRYAPRGLVAFGTIVTAVSLFMYGELDPLSGALEIIGPQLIRGVGLAFMMSPLLTAAINAVPPPAVATASSFLNVAQRVGGAFGIALLNTFVTSSIHAHAVRMGSQLPVQSGAFQRLAAHGAAMAGAGAGSSAAPAPLLAAQAIQHRASVLGFDNGFVLAGAILLAGLPLCLLLQRTAGREGRRPAAAR
jgi:hypothetical protein